MESCSGNIRCEELVDSIYRYSVSREAPTSNDSTSSGTRRVRPAAREPAANVTLVSRARKIITLMAFAGMIGGILSLNFLAYVQQSDNIGNIIDKAVDPINSYSVFSTYYKGSYEICQNSREVRVDGGRTVDRPGRCFSGDMDATFLFKDVAMDSYVRVYLLLSLEFPRSGGWWKFWKSKPSGLESSNRTGRIYLGLSSIEMNKNNQKITLTGLSPNFGSIPTRGPLKDYWPEDALKQHIWSDYGAKSIGPICSFRAFVNHPTPNRKQTHIREQDDFYFMAIRKYVFNEFEHLSDFDMGRFNPFNALSRSLEKPVQNNEEFLAGTGKNLGEFPNVETPLDGETVAMTGEVNSSDCGISIKLFGAEKSTADGEAMLQMFSLTYIIKSIIECVSLFRQFKKIDEEARGQTISIISLCMVSYQDLLEIFFLLYHGSAYQNALLTFGLMMFIRFFLLAVVEHSFIVLIWRANHAAQIREGWVTTQRRFILFYRYYFSFTLIQLVIWYFFYDSNPWVVVFTYFCWVPQIMLDMWRGQCCALHILTVFTMSICRLFMPLYLFMKRDNAFTFDVFAPDAAKQNHFVSLAIVIISMIQIVVMSLQRLHGPRYFASWSILPQIYDYVRPWGKMMQDDPQECVICIYDIVYSKKDWCITPCDHLFHTACLREWASIKLECPNCRQPLPPMN